jgi:hypothetical protein
MGTGAERIMEMQRKQLGDKEHARTINGTLNTIAESFEVLKNNEDNKKLIGSLKTLESFFKKELAKCEVVS